VSPVLDGAALRQGILSSLEDLRASRAAIDAANVYPVADSDTGTNLVMTLEAVAAALEKSADSPTAIARAVRSGSLVGARGNSGVIMAQIFRAWADAVETGPLDVEGVARAFKRAVELAYEAVLEPAEGTILTVATAAAEAAQGPHEDVAEQFVAAARAATEALARTPEQMPALAAAGVVDAGGMGLVIVLEAFARALGGDVGHPARAASVDATPPPVRDEASAKFAYEVQYLLRSDAVTLDPLRKLLGTIGDSVAVVGGDGLWRVHVHTDDRERAVSLGEAFGEPSQVEVVDFAQQIRATNERAMKDTAITASEQPSRGVRGIPLARSEHGATLVAVVSGEGVAQLFHELGAITVDGAIRGTVGDNSLRAAIDSAPTDDVIVLPNNEDVYERLFAMKDSFKRRVIVLRSGDLGEGLAAAVAYGDARDTDAAVHDMEAALRRVRTGMVLVATEAFETVAGPVEAGQAVGIAEGAIVEIVDSAFTAAVKVATALLIEGVRDLLTVLCAGDVFVEERERLATALKAEHPRTTIEIYDGGQPVHRYIMAAE
jgi:fatty acid kinase